MRNTDIVLRWLDQIPIERACQESVYGQDVGTFHNGCFEHPNVRDGAVVIWLTRRGLNKLPRLQCFGDNSALGAGFLRYVFADEARKGLPYESLVTNEDCLLLERRCQQA